MKRARLDFGLLLDAIRAMNSAQGNILEMAKNGEILAYVEDQKGEFFFPYDRQKSRFGNAIHVIEGEDEAAEFFLLHPVKWLAIKRGANITPIVAGNILLSPLYELESVADKIREYARIAGIDRARSALHIGITFESFDRIARKIPLSYNNEMFLLEYLDYYIGINLTRDITWLTKTSYINDFIIGHNLKNAEKIEMQRCSISGCNDVASYRCGNALCNSSNPLFLCTVHRILRPEIDRNTKEFVVRCPDCEARGI